MLIEAPCRLGERFTHHRSYSNPKEQYLVGIDLFVWHCNIDGVTLMGSPNKKGRVERRSEARRVGKACKTRRSWADGYKRAAQNHAR